MASLVIRVLRMSCLSSYGSCGVESPLRVGSVIEVIGGRGIKSPMFDIHMYSTYGGVP